jgi:hypothetical protein
MTTLDVHTNGEGCWPDLGERGFISGQITGIARLPHATESGRSSVTVRIELPTGRIVLAQTTLALLSTAVKAFEVAEEVGR